MISAGAETHRVEDMITRMLKTTGYEQADAFVLPTGITVTLADGKDDICSVTRRVSPGTNNLSRICSVNTVSRDFCSGKITLEQAKSRLEEIKSEHIYAVPLKILGTMIACGAFTVLFGGSLPEGLAAIICGIFVALINYGARKLIGRDFICDALCAVVLTIVTLLLTHFAAKWDIFILRPQYVIVGSIMPLVPGVAITNAIRDILQGDYISSCARIIEAFMIAASVAIGVGAGIIFAEHVSLLTEEFGFALENSRRGVIGFLLGFASAAISTIGFSTIFEVPRKYIFTAAAVSGLGWMTYLSAIYAGISVDWSSFMAAGVIEVLSYALARIQKAPITTFLICGILPLVPGAGIYRAAYSVIFSDTSEALLETLTIAGAIALAIIVMDTLLNIINKLFKKVKKSHRGAAL